MRNWIVTGIVSAALVSLYGATALAGPTDAQKCEAAKNKTAGKYAFCRQKAEAKAVKKGDTPDYDKCIEKFDDAWDKSETKYPTCPTSGDGADIKALVESCMSGVAAKLDCAGAFVGGHCWYLGASGDSCDDTCVASGSSYEAAGGTYVTTTNANCNAVMDALGDASPPLPGGSPPICLVPMGCYRSGGSRALCSGSTSDALIGGAERACPCGP
jgi:hypothetical protein